MPDLFISGGAGSLGSSVDLTSEVTGTLPVGNGGTGTSTQFTQGSVVFAGASGVYSQDNANFFYDATSKRIGIGTATPEYDLQINATAPKIALKPSSGSRSFLIQPNDAAGALDFKLSSLDGTFRIGFSATDVHVESQVNTAALIFRANQGNITFTTHNGGGSGIIAFGKRHSDGHTAVGASSQFWPTTAQTTPIIEAVEPGGATASWSVLKDGISIHGGEESKKPSTGSNCAIFADGTVPATLASNTAGLYADDVSGTVNMYAINEAGESTRLSFPAPQTYTETNVTTDRAFDADTVAIAELADVVGTLIGDLRARGILA